MPTQSKHGVCQRTKRCQNRLAVKRRALRRLSNPLPVYPPCRVCGQPTRSAAGICSRTPECVLANRRVQPSALAAAARVARRKPCEICGCPTTAKLGVCRRTAECLREYDLRWRMPRRVTASNPCEVCGRLTIADGGICNRAGPCSQARWRAAHPRTRCRLCHGPTNSPVGVCKANPKCRGERRRIRLQRPDRPCRYVKAGCTEFAMIGRAQCREHYLSDNRRQAQHHRDRLAHKLTLRQDWHCPWCSELLPADLAGVHVDHIIPKVSGVIIEDEWNLQALHQSCNLSKHDKITPQALTLAAEHGMLLGNQPAAAA